MRAVPKSLILPCLCCISFYTGVQLTGKTEAVFSSQVKADPITISAAYVFPDTIKQLVNQAGSIQKDMKAAYDEMPPASTGISIEDWKAELLKVEDAGQKLKKQEKTLNDVYKKMCTYNNEIPSGLGRDIKEYVFVREGFQRVRQIESEVKITENYKNIESLRSTIEQKIKEQEEKANTSIEVPTKTENNQPQRAVQVNKVLPNHSNIIKQVKKNAEENHPNSK
ncbi:DUF4047 domain-containing protein [Heyndrickxia acidicola]|uniref:DUF4047 domain-containing protein n=1 Tax=Heyndrickxia acidicola TaxID=209389 RepID=A0ABU6MP45_9BACI|nr:DUF4047 domain-containing protein [Heyndrickxia acidicola]MED1205761.1 DUF4047 domain-containing protein [Heyndrickxia acidicola]